MAMSKSFKNTLITGGIFIAVYLLNKYGAFQTFLKTYTIRLGTPSFNQSESKKTWYSKLILNVPMLVNNPSELSGIITSVKIAVSVNGQKVADIDKMGEIKLSPHSSAAINLLIAIPTLSIPSIVENLVKGAKDQSLNILLTGAIKTDQGLIDVNQSLNVKL
jgi:hypothetical protein